MSMKMKMEEQENLSLIPPTATLEIDKDLTLLPRIKLNLTVHPSTPSSSITNQIDEWKTKRALLDFLQTSHSLPFPLPEEDLQFKRFNKDLKKRKREDPVVYGTLHIWDLSFLSEKNENDVVKWRNGLVEKLNGVELNLQGVRFRLEVDVPECDDFDGMKKNWEEFYAFRDVNRSSRREPDTIVVSGVPSRWFAETRVSSKPSMLVTHTIFSKFGKIRNLNVAEDDSGKDANEDSVDLVSGLYCKIVVQFEKYRDFHDALRVLSGRSLQKQGSRLKADYVVTWDKDEFFRNSRNQTQEKNNAISTTASDHYRSEAPRRQVYNSRHSPDKVRSRRFRVSNNTPTRNHNQNNNADGNDDEDENRSASRKRRKKINDESEDRLQKMEALHIKARMSSQAPSTSSGSASASSDDGEEDGAVSTSEDGIYSEKVEPAFDLMKDMLRHSYTGTTKSVPVVEEKEKNIELDIGNTSKAAITVNADGGKSKSCATTGKHSKGSVSNTGGKGSVSNTGGGKGGGDVEMKGKGGPMFKDLGGMKAIIEELIMDIVSLCNPQLPRHLGVKPVTGILLHGPPGCGKTRLAHAIANETGLPFHHISATEVISGVSGASEEYIRELFDKAKRTAPSIVFIDEIDAIASKRENLQREMEKRIVTQLMTSMDEPESSDEPRGYVLVIGATNRPDSLDPALRRPGRFDREFLVGVPDESARVEILSVLTRNLKLDGSFDLHKIARSTPGFVGADLTALANKAGILAMKRILDERKRELSQDSMDEDTQGWWKEPWLPEEINKSAIKMSDFEEAAKMVQPSARREGFSSIPNVKWEDVGGLDILRHEFDRYIVRRIKYPELYEGIGMNLESGFLLYGPPGCGKTLIAKAVANEAGANFIHIKGPELLNKYVGESELAVRTLFIRARTCAPCVLFFDEVDALTTERGKEGGWVTERLLNQLLIELDGAENRRGVFVIGATNRPEVMDRALLRPGRFGKLLYVPLPSPDGRVLILKALARNNHIDSSVDLNAIGRMESCENLSGADLAEVMNEAGMIALDEKLSSSETTSLTIKTSHFELALSKFSPSVSDKQRQYYERLSKSLRTGRA